MYTLEREQTVSASLAAAWDFLKNPANLNEITPDDLHFSIISPVPDVMFDGLLIEYRITVPLFGVRPWVAEIKHIRELHSFVDEQRRGPYSFWYHYHELVELPDGVKIIDRVYYDLPWAIIGDVLHSLFIGKTLHRIFDYRREKLAQILKR